jgi:hypothetical protein
MGPVVSVGGWGYPDLHSTICVLLLSILSGGCGGEDVPSSVRLCALSIPFVR